MSSLNPKVTTIPQTPGVYLYKDKLGIVIYVGKAGNLRRRVSSYFQKNHKHSRTEELVREIADIEIRKTPTVIEALILEAELIKKYQPKFNVREKDNTSFLYVVFTREPWPKPVLVRGKELEALTRGGTAVPPRVKSKLSEYSKNPVSNRIFGPFVSASSIRVALHILRKSFPYSTCAQASSRIPDQIGDVAISSAKGGLRRDARNDGRTKPCFNYQIGLCPGVCVGAITKQEYARNIRNLILFFRGKKQQILRDLKKQMRQASKDENFEEASKLRNQIFALRHIRDTALIEKTQIFRNGRRSEAEFAAFAGATEPHGSDISRSAVDREAEGEGVNIFGRIEGYDISNISGTSAVGSMVVFTRGEPSKDEYRKFKIKTVKGANDVAMMREMLNRRFADPNLNPPPARRGRRGGGKHWPLPDLLVIDGGLGQVNVTREVLRTHNFNIPIIGIAKGFMRKQDRPVIYSSSEVEKLELQRIVENHKDLILRVRDESHRFAVSYHRKLRAKKSLQ